MRGILIAFTILTFWFISLSFGLSSVNLNRPQDVLSYLWLVLVIQFLYVGLFITVHDACHGSVAIGKPKVNLWIGRLFGFLYAGLSFDRIKFKHQHHHQFSGTDKDPDFHPSGYSFFFFWLLRFFKNYITIYQLIIMFGTAHILINILRINEINVYAFWVVPSVLSSLQLFYFGTYLPHRAIKNAPFTDQHRTRNFSVSYFFSLISCYHFGAFHHVHHTAPAVPWFKLPDNTKVSTNHL